MLLQVDNGLIGPGGRYSFHSEVQLADLTPETVQGYVNQNGIQGTVIAVVSLGAFAKK